MRERGGERKRNFAFEVFSSSRGRFLRRRFRALIGTRSRCKVGVPSSVYRATSASSLRVASGRDAAAHRPAAVHVWASPASGTNVASAQQTLALRRPGAVHRSRDVIGRCEGARRRHIWHHVAANCCSAQCSTDWISFWRHLTLHSNRIVLNSVAFVLLKTEFSFIT